MIGDADTVRETVDGEREYKSPGKRGPLTPVSLKIRLILAALFVAGCLLIFLPSHG
jgi:hypothetical protein